jgi:hypothetical protein
MFKKHGAVGLLEESDDRYVEGEYCKEGKDEKIVLVRIGSRRCKSCMSGILLSIGPNYSIDDAGVELL